MAQRVVILGASGLLGGWLAKKHGRAELLATARRRAGPSPLGLNLTRADLTDLDGLTKSLRAFRPQLIYWVAALTSPALCQARPDLAWAVNATPAARLVELAREFSGRLVLVSSDLVFDGIKGDYSESDPPRPVSVYGATKAAAERVVLAASAEALVVRVSLIIGADPWGLAGHLGWLAGVVQAGGRATLFTDEFRHPAAAPELARGLAALAERAPAGLYHLAGPEKLSRYDLGRLIFEGQGWPLDRLVPGRLTDQPADPPRPADLSLNLAKAKAVLGQDFPRPLGQTLAEALKPPRLFPVPTPG